MSAPQKDKTVQFWDDLYAGDDNHEREWILLPTQTIIDRIYERLPRKALIIRILEIGCGTSILSRLVYEYCRDRPDGPQVHILATDVSQVCIQQLQERDAALLGRREDGSGLDYQVLNIAEPLNLEQTTELLQPDSFDLILDKGCLDTFAFRSRQRGTQKGTLVCTVLDNLHKLLRLGDNEKDTAGAYLIFSPRRKFQPVKEYPGFAKVERTPLGVPKGELMESNGKANVKVDPELYLHACFKGTMKDPVESSSALEDTDTCPKCGISFYDFRKGEAIHGRGVKFWTRLFRGHGRHCKGIVEG